jgi:hypothetical protein
LYDLGVIALREKRTMMDKSIHISEKSKYKWGDLTPELV